MYECLHGKRESCLEEDGFATFSAGPTTFSGAIIRSLKLKVPTLSKQRRSESHVSEHPLQLSSRHLQIPPPAHALAVGAVNTCVIKYCITVLRDTSHLWVPSGELGRCVLQTTFSPHYKHTSCFIKCLRCYNTTEQTLKFL